MPLPADENTSATSPEFTAAKGKVIFVGAGPGNPDLLTIRAREVLERNAVAVVDPDVSAGVRDVVGAGLPVPEEKLKAADEAYEEMCAKAKEAGARRKPPRPAGPTAAERPRPHRRVRASSRRWRPRWMRWLPRSTAGKQATAM